MATPERWCDPMQQYPNEPVEEWYIDPRHLRYLMWQCNAANWYACALHTLHSELIKMKLGLVRYRYELTNDLGLCGIVQLASDQCTYSYLRI